jgi:hypothetical protein
MLSGIENLLIINFLFILSSRLQPGEKKQRPLQAKQPASAGFSFLD